MSAVLARARALLDVPFQLQGRDPDIGIDCVGLVILAADIPDAPRPDYRRRGDHFRPFIERSAPWLRRIAPRQARPGDVGLIACQRGHWHVGILAEGGLLHADAGVGRVVLRPGPLPGNLRAVLRRRRFLKGKAQSWRR